MLLQSCEARQWLSNSYSQWNFSPLWCSQKVSLVLLVEASHCTLQDHNSVFCSKTLLHYPSYVAAQSTFVRRQHPFTFEDTASIWAPSLPYSDTSLKTEKGSQESFSPPLLNIRSCRRSPPALLVPFKLPSKRQSCRFFPTSFVCFVGRILLG